MRQWQNIHETAIRATPGNTLHASQLCPCLSLSALAQLALRTSVALVPIARSDLAVFVRYIWLRTCLFVTWETRFVSLGCVSHSTCTAVHIWPIGTLIES